MISPMSVWAIVLHYLRRYKRDLNLSLGIFYWPLLDIVTWGFVGAWVQQSGMNQFHNYETVALLGVLLSQVAARGANVISFTLCEELWQNNIVNLFSLPLRMIEWISGVIVYFAIMSVAIALCSIFFIYMLYNVSLWQIISTFMLFAPPLFFCGIWLGFTCLQIVVLLGKRGTELGFVAIWFLLPFSGAYYPTDVLPAWGQKISAFVPMSYIFNGMRSYVIYQQSPVNYLIKGYILSIVYALVGVLLFVYFFNRAKQKGLVRLID